MEGSYLIKERTFTVPSSYVFFENFVSHMLTNIVFSSRLPGSWVPILDQMQCIFLLRTRTGSQLGCNLSL